MKRFKYLGVMQSVDASSCEAMHHRMGAASMAFRQLKSFWGCSMDKRIKGRLFVATVRSVLLHGASTWTMHAHDYRLLETFEMSCVRQVLKISKLRRIPSAALRGMLGITTSIADEVQRERLRLFGHVSRMDSHRWGRILVEDGVNGSSNGAVGRPSKTGLQCVQSDVRGRMKSTEFGLRQAADLARRSRNRFRNELVFGISR